MTNQAILNILNNLCKEARESAHATLGLIELLDGAPPDPQLRDGLEAGRYRAGHLMRSLDDIRELFSSSSPTSKMAEKFDVAQSVSQTIDLLNLASGEKTRQIVLKAPPEPIMISQDRHALENVLTRVLDASMKIGGAGEVRVTIDTGVNGDSVQFGITPPNPGVAADLANWLKADPEHANFQEDAVTSAVAVVVAGKRLRSLTGAHEAVRLSRDKKSLAIALPSEPKGSGTSNAAPRRSGLAPDALNVLLVEDNDESYALSELMFLNENVCRALNGPEAIDMVARYRFDIVFMDIHMPGMDGYTTIGAIRSWETETASARTPVVILSSDDLETQWRFAAKSGCTGFLRKPLRKSELSDLLKRLRAARLKAS